MLALHALRDAVYVLRERPWLVAAGTGAALVSAVETAGDSALLTLLDLGLGAWVTAGIVGVAFKTLTNRWQHEPRGFLYAANSYALRLVGANLVAGIASLLLLAIPGIVAWSVLKPELVAVVVGGTPSVGPLDVAAAVIAVVSLFAVSLLFGLVAPAVVHGHGALGGIGEGVSRVLSGGRESLAFGAVNAAVALVATGPGLYTFLVGLLRDPTTASSLGGTTLLLLWLGGTVSATFGPLYATAFYDRIGGSAPR